MDFLKLITLFSALLIAGCQLPYLAKSAFHQTKILTQRKDLQKVLTDPTVSADNKRKLKIAQLAREYASGKLGLKVKDNYTTFVQLENSYVTYVVNASDKYALKSFTWWFPIIGSVPYKGYPDEKEAEAEAESLKAQGFDTYVRGVSAYSTLGWFSDPILSSMLNYKDHDLVNTIIHESAHSTVYIKSSADFNESLAVFVGDLGTEKFYLEHEGENSPTVKAINDEKLDTQLFNGWMKGQIEALEKFYFNLENKQEPLRQAAFQRIQKNFESDVLPFLKTDSYKNFASKPLNNARIMLFKTYSDEVSNFAELYQKCKEQLPCFFKKIELLKDAENPSDSLKSMLQAME